jgi:hypothetical protein
MDRFENKEIASVTTCYIGNILYDNNIGGVGDGWTVRDI